jgi:hypothetical protein
MALLRVLNKGKVDSFGDYVPCCWMNQCKFREDVCNYVSLVNIIYSVTYFTLFYNVLRNSEEYIFKILCIGEVWTMGFCRHILYVVNGMLCFTFCVMGFILVWFAGFVVTKLNLYYVQSNGLITSLWSKLNFTNRDQHIFSNKWHRNQRTFSENKYADK